MTRLTSLEMLDRLVAFDTVSRSSNLELIGFVRDYLDGWGVSSRLLPSADGRKANLFATLGPERPGGLILSGHTDVVPVDDQDWSSDPFRLDERDERLYGRGACDMKGFIAVALALVPELIEAASERPIHLALTYDEEVGCLGVRDVESFLADSDLAPAACLVGEPTGLAPVIAHKGKRNVRVRVRGREAHSSLTHRGVNAVEAAARLVARISDLAERHREAGPHDDTFDPPYTTIHTGTFHGGHALNIVPSECLVDFELRTIPGASSGELLAEIERYAAEELEPGMQAVDPRAGFVFEDTAEYPMFDMPAGHPAVRAALDAAGAGEAGKVSYGTEAGFYRRLEIPTVICGPGHIAQAHRPDEFVAMEQLVRCEDVVRRWTRLAGRDCG